MYECKASVYMTQGRVCSSLDNDLYIKAAPLSKEKELEEGIPTEEELRKESKKRIGCQDGMMGKRTRN